MQKLVIFVVLIYSLAERLFSSEALLLSGEPKSRAFFMLDGFLTRQERDRRDKLDFETVRNLFAKIAMNSRIKNEPWVGLANEIANLAVDGGNKTFCKPENLLRLGRVIDMSINYDRRPGDGISADSQYKLDVILEKYAKHYDCSQIFQGEWDRLDQDSMLGNKYEKLLSRLDSLNVRRSPDPLKREVYGALLIKRLSQSSFEIPLLIKEVESFFSHRKMIQSCVGLENEKVSERLLQPLLAYVRTMDFTSSPSMLRWAARLSTCQALLVQAKKLGCLKLI